MIKYINNDYPGFESQAIRLEPNFEKVAYQFGDPVKEFIENKVKPTKGSNFYLINSMGSGEIYGSNTRGDYFPRKELKEHHKTFESTPARVYVQHRNKDVNIRLGDVLFSHFNDDTDRVELVQRVDWDRVFRFAPDWVKSLLQTNSPYNTSMGCLISTSKINTLEGLKEIKDILEGDLVKTHTGQYKKVTGLFSKYFNEGIYTIKVQSFGKEFKVTYEHPFLILPKEEIYYNGRLQHKKLEGKNLEPKWIKTQDLKVGDYACYVFNTEVEEDLETTQEFSRLLGWYLSDGNIYKDKRNNSYCLNVFIGKGEERYVEELENILKKLTSSNITIKFFEDRNYYKISIYDKKLCEKLIEYGGKNSHNKKVSKKVMKWKPELQLELLGAFINGDGFLFDNCSHFEIANYELAMQLCEMASRNGITWTIQEIIHKANENSVCRTGLESISWQVSFCKKWNEKLANVTDKSGVWEEGKNYPDRKFIWKNYIFSPITKIEFDDSWEGMIYNFEVEDDESYVADNIVMHNCTVDHEYCSYCGKKNKLINQRCDHLARRMNQFIDGTRIVAVNVKPKFFDNSIVMRGADKIARSLKKIASDPYVDEILNAEETIMNDSELSGKSYFIIDSEKSIKVDKPEKLAFIREETFDQVSNDSFYLSKQFIDSILESNLEDILGVTKIAGAELLPHEYQYIVLKKLGQDEEAERRWNYGIRFKLEDKPSNNIEKLALGYDRELLAKFAECIPFKSNYKPFVFYRGMSKVASDQTPIKWTVVEDPVLSSAYADYLCKDMEKVADLKTILPFLSALFLTLPSLMSLQKSTDRLDKIETKNIKMVTNTKSRASEIPMLPFVPNPVFHNPLFQSGLGMESKPVYIINNPTKTASFGKTLSDSVRSAGDKVVNSVQNVGTKIRNKAPLTFHWGAPAALAAATTVSLAGKDRQKEQQGDPTAGTGMYGFAHKHPIITGGGLTLLGHMASNRLVKKSSEKDLTNYKEFLKTASQEQLLEFLGKIPDDLFFDLIN